MENLLVFKITTIIYIMDKTKIHKPNLFVKLDLIYHTEMLGIFINLISDITNKNLLKINRKKIK